MNELNIMTVAGVDCYEENGLAWLRLETVARGLGFTDTRSGTEYVRWARVDAYLNELGFATSGERPEFIPENVFYRLAMKAKNAAAEAFQAKIADEVIPAIRKHGGYLTPEAVEAALLNPDTLIRLATDLKTEREQRLALEAQADRDRPKVLFADSVSVAVNSILVRELAKLLCQNGVEMGQNRLFTWLRENGWLIKQRGGDYNLPTQKAVERGLFEIKETVHTSATGQTRITRTPKVTGKGQLYFVNLFLGQKGAAS